MRRSCDFIIDELTNSIKEVSTGKSFETEVSLITKEDLKIILKKNGWRFNWRSEFQIENHNVYKVTITGSNKIQGLISLEPILDLKYIELHLIENAPHNLGRKKQFEGVAGNLVAHACKMSFELNFGGYVAFIAKSKLVEHYKIKLSAVSLYPRERMGILPDAAKILVASYFK